MKRACALLAFLLCATAAFGAPATKFVVTAPPNTNISVPFNVTVTAVDSTDATDTTFAGTIHFASSSAGTLPADYTFVAGDGGTHTFWVTLTTVSRQSITVTCGPINGNTYTTLYFPATWLAFSMWDSPTLGPLSLSVGAYGPTRSDRDVLYTGTVHFTCPLGAVTLPPDYTFTQADFGYHRFTVIVSALGPTVINVNDDHGFTGQLVMTVWCPPPSRTTVNPIIAPAGVCANITNAQASLTLDAGATTYDWIVTNGTVTSGQGTPSITFNGGPRGWVQFNVNAISAEGCLVGRYAGYSTISAVVAATINGGTSMAVCRNTPVTLDVSLTGTAPFTLRWSDGFTQTVKSGAKALRTMTFAAATSLRITSVSDANCTRDVASNSVQINVGGAPVISQQPQSTSIRAGGSAALNVSGTGLSYYWYQGEAGDTTNRVAIGASSFTTPALRETTKYWVRALTNCGFVDSDQAIVTVMPGKHRGAAH